MNVQELVELCQLVEKLQTGHGNVKEINKVFATIPTQDRLVTKKQKIKKILEYFDEQANKALELFIINRGITQGWILTGNTNEGQILNIDTDTIS